nr:TetR/AcrR family transcriptional regulator [Acinetobacter sp. Marseille-Q1620]
MKNIPKPRKLPIQGRAKTTVEAILQSTAHILVQKGYEGLTTNLVAEIAGVSIGSLYQYFPNKEALIAALHSRHSLHIHALLKEMIRFDQAYSLSEHIEQVVDAVILAHAYEPELHGILEKEFSFFDEIDNEDKQGIEHIIYKLIEQHKNEIKSKNKDLDCWIVLKMLESLVHSAVIDPPEKLTQPELRNAIIHAICAYLIA